MVAGLAAGFHVTGFLALEMVHEFGDNCFLHAKLFLTGMRERSVDAGEPG